MWTDYLVNVEWLVLEAPPLAAIGCLAKAPEEEEEELSYLKYESYMSVDEMLEEE